MKNPAAENAFTLIELLVSSGILAIVMMVLLTSMSTGLSLWRNTEQKVSVDRDGRTAMQLLAEDLAGIVNLNNPSLQPQFDTSSNAVTPLRFLTLKPRCVLHRIPLREQRLEARHGDECRDLRRFDRR